MSAELSTLIFMGFVLKIPVAFMFWIVWWALRKKPEPADPSGGWDDHGFRRFDREPSPLGPRRDPHSGGAIPPPGDEHEGRRRPASTTKLPVIQRRSGRTRERQPPIRT